MSLGIVITGPEGVVLAADTRVTVTRGDVTADFDNASKLLVLGDHVAAVTYGAGSIGGRSAHSLIPEFRREAVGSLPITAGVADYASALQQFFHLKWVNSGSNEAERSMSFLVGGISAPSPIGERWSIDGLSTGPNLWGDSFGMTWGGQSEIVSRLLKGYDPRLEAHLVDQYPQSEIRRAIQNWEGQFATAVPTDVLPLQDCVDLAELLINTTIAMQSLTITSRGVGGTAEIVTITPEEGVQWIRKREIRASGQR